MSSQLDKPAARPPIRVFLVDDSTLSLAVLQKLLATSSGMLVVGTARNGREALELIPKLRPDVICTDYQMPVMDGLELTRQVMARFPTPILVVSAVVRARETPVAFKLFEAGALDVFPKPLEAATANAVRSAEELTQKIRILAGVTVFTRRDANFQSEASPGFSEPFPKSEVAIDVKVVAIGASTGGPQAFKEVLKNLPATLPSPVVCVQHISDGFLEGLVGWLDACSRLRVRVADQGELAMPGVAYFPPDRTHLEIDGAGRLRVTRTAPVGGHCPSVDVLFKSAAQQFGRHALGVLLSGMGSDGAEGLLAIAQAGGNTIAQNEASCVVFGMPKVAIELGAAKHVLPLEAIAPKIVSLFT